MKTLSTTAALLAAGLPLLGCGGAPVAPCESISGNICTVAGSGIAGLGNEGILAVKSPLYLPEDLTVGPDAKLYIMDWNNHRVRAVDGEGLIRTVIGDGQLGDAPDGAALSVSFNHPTHLIFDKDGTIILSAWHNSKLKRVNLATGEIKHLAGSGKRTFGGDNGPAAMCDFDLPVATALARDGSLYVADQANQRVRQISLDGTIRTVVGTGEAGFAGEGEPALTAKLTQPVGQAASPSGKIATDAQGNLYIADSGNQRVRRVDAASGMISTFAGTGVAGSSGDGAAARQAQLSRPTDVALGPDGSVFIADTDNSCIRKVDPAGVISTVAGVCGQTGYDGDGKAATSAQLARPFGIDVGLDGKLYIADTYNHRIRVVIP